MLRSIRIENFRGFERLDVEDLGRFNLVIGRNDSGTTSFLGAAAFSMKPGGLSFARLLAHPVLYFNDIERVWRPLFRGGQTEIPIRLLTTDELGISRAVEIKMERHKRTPDGHWATVTYNVTNGPQEMAHELDYGTILVKSNVANTSDESSEAWWTSSQLDPEDDLLHILKKVYVSGKIDRMVEIVREIQPNLERIDAVGEAIYVVLRGFPLPLPLSVLGDGARRMLELALPIVQEDRWIYIDEIENSFHWSNLDKVLNLLRTSKAEQIFATARREEVLKIACEHFIAAGDDSLRIIRLDRTETGHRAVVYHAEAALAAMESGLEIRG